MKIVAENEHYILAVDPVRNRVYLTLIGFWKSRAVAPRYLEDLRRATRDVTRGYTILTDLTKMKAPPADVTAMHTEAQQLLVAAGLSKTAEILGEDIIARMSVDRISRVSGMYKGTFDNWREAESWLDKVEVR